MSSMRLWNSHQRQKFLRAEASRDILKFRVLEMVFPGGFSGGSFHETGKNDVEMYQVFHNIG